MGAAELAQREDGGGEAGEGVGLALAHQLAAVDGEVVHVIRTVRARAARGFRT